MRFEKAMYDMYEYIKIYRTVNITRIILLKNNRVEIAYKVQNKHP